MLASTALWFLLCQAVVRAMPSQDDDEVDLRDEGEPIRGSEALAARFGAALFGSPDYKTGEAVANWDPSSHVKPEELGSYPEGDILFPPREDGVRNSIKGLSYLWPNGVIPYAVTGKFTSNELGVISRAMDEFHRRSCIRFVPRTNQRDYVTITNAATGCWTSVGRRGGAQVVNLQSPGCVTYSGTAMHEFLHVLGFFHEQSRAERDQYVRIKYENVQRGKENNFGKEDTDGLGVQYDYESIMHYSAQAFSSNGRPTIEPLKPGVQLIDRYEFSAKDLQKLKKMYRCAS